MRRGCQSSCPLHGGRRCGRTTSTRSSNTARQVLNVGVCATRRADPPQRAARRAQKHHRWRKCMTSGPGIGAVRTAAHATSAQTLQNGFAPSRQALPRTARTQTCPRRSHPHPCHSWRACGSRAAASTTPSPAARQGRELVALRWPPPGRAHPRPPRCAAPAPRLCATSLLRHCPQARTWRASNTPGGGATNNSCGEEEGRPRLRKVRASLDGQWRTPCRSVHEPVVAGL